MNAESIVKRLEFFPRVIDAVTSTLDPADASWKPAPQHWSILEVCCHLLDEEKEDFRPRIRSTLEDASRPWPPLVLDDVSSKRAYLSRDLRQTVSDFARERAASIAWLRGNLASDWSTSYQHPKAGPLRAGELLACWAAHDALHLRQIARRLHELAGRDSDGHSLKYAGDW